MEFLILLYMSFSVEMMFSKQTCIVIYLVVFFVIDTFERVQVEIALFYFKSGGISLKVCLTTLYHISVVFYFMQTITLDIIESMHITHKDYVLHF